jgi:hypothetical protein
LYITSYKLFCCDKVSYAPAKRNINIERLYLNRPIKILFIVYQELCTRIEEIKAIIVTWFKQSVLASDKLRKLQQESGNEKKKKLIQGVSTRWKTQHMK